MQFEYDDAPIRNELSSEELLKVIFDYTAKIANERDLTNVLLLMMDMGRKMVIADRCTVWLLDHAKKELWTKSAHGVDEIRIPIDSGIVGEVVRTGEAIFIPDAYKDSRFNQTVDQKTGYRTKSIVTIPFKNNDNEIIGAYQAINKMTEARIFTERDIEFLTLAATYCGKSIEAALLYNEIEETQKEILFIMGEIGESRSEETGNHVKRVAQYSYLLAKGIGLSEAEAELLKIASPMHDIGKVGIPDAILQKPGKLTKEEFEFMKTHTTIGYSLLKNSRRRIIQTAATIAHEHHEKWDGTGYPRCLKGEEIHLFSRITAIADVFDALSSERAYKKAWELERIVKLFNEERGKQFDPKLVDVFHKKLPEIIKIKEEFADRLSEE